MNRLYHLRAFSKIGSMETTTEVVYYDNELFLLIPFLIIGQIFQLYISYVLFCIGSHTSDLPAFVGGFLFAAVGIGNFSTTLLTCVAKIYKSK